MNFEAIMLNSTHRTVGFAFLGSGFAQMFGQIAFIRVKTLSIINFVLPRHIKGEEDSLPVAPLP